MINLVSKTCIPIAYLLTQTFVLVTVVALSLSLTEWFDFRFSKFGAAVQIAIAFATTFEIVIFLWSDRCFPNRISVGKMISWIVASVVVGVIVFSVSLFFLYLDRSTGFISPIFREGHVSPNGFVAESEKAWTNTKLHTACLVIVNLFGVSACLCYLFHRSPQSDQTKETKLFSAE